jgi:hypothetical protein
VAEEKNYIAVKKWSQSGQEITMDNVVLTVYRCFSKVVGKKLKSVG